MSCVEVYYAIEVIRSYDRLPLFPRSAFVSIYEMYLYFMRRFIPRANLIHSSVSNRPILARISNHHGSLHVSAGASEVGTDMTEPDRSIDSIV